MWRLRISMDPAYPRIIEATCRAMEAVVPGKHAHRYHRERAGYVEVSMYWKHWPWLLPQHGPGRKHLRRIALEPWQVTIVADHREALIRGAQSQRRLSRRSQRSGRCERPLPLQQPLRGHQAHLLRQPRRPRHSVDAPMRQADRDLSQDCGGLRRHVRRAKALSRNAIISLGPKARDVARNRLRI